MTTTKEKVFTRQDYLNKKCSHREYYSQYVTEGIRKGVCSYIGIDKLRASTDEHLNDIPLKEWDYITVSILSCTGLTLKMEERGDYSTLAGHVCILKEAARQVIEEDN